MKLISIKNKLISLLSILCLITLISCNSGSGNNLNIPNSINSMPTTSNNNHMIKSNGLVASSIASSGAGFYMAGPVNPLENPLEMISYSDSGSRWNYMGTIKSMSHISITTFITSDQFEGAITIDEDGNATTRLKKTSGSAEYRVLSLGNLTENNPVLRIVYGYINGKAITVILTNNNLVYSGGPFISQTVRANLNSDYNYTDVNFDPTHDRFLLIGTRKNNPKLYVIFQSQDGVNWTPIKLGSQEKKEVGPFNRINCGPGMYPTLTYIDRSAPSSVFSEIGILFPESDTITNVEVDMNNIYDIVGRGSNSANQNNNYNAIESNNNLEVMIGDANHIKISHDDGLTWESVSYDSSNVLELSSEAINESGIIMITGLDQKGNRMLLTTENGKEFTPINSLLFTNIASSYNFSCGIESAGSLFCWGSGNDGKLGYGDTDDIILPKQVQSESKFTQVSAGVNHACAVTTDKQIACWGDNSYGQLGNNQTKMASTPTPVAKMAGIQYNQVSLGQVHSCALGLDTNTKTNRILCWGDNSLGQLGVGSSIAKSSVPKAISISSSHNFIQVASTFSDTCGITNNHQVYCWGDNQFGQLGLGKTKHTAYYTPEKLSQTFSYISSGPSQHVCALDESGTAYCWGRNDFGQLGIGNSEDQNKPTKVVTKDNYLQFIKIATGGGNTCAISKAYDLYCWGDDRFGQLGNGESSESSVLYPTYPIDIPNQKNPTQWQDVSVGYYHVCATTIDGQNYCWGYNYDGEVGNNSREEEDIPTDITSNLNESQ